MQSKRSAKLDLAAPASSLQVDPFAALNALPAEALRTGLPPARPTPAPAPTPPKPKGRLILRRETKERGGKTVVVISSFPGPGAMPGAALEELARTLRKQLGCGGTVDGREIVIQGDRPAVVAGALRKIGFSVGGVVD